MGFESPLSLFLVTVRIAHVLQLPTFVSLGWIRCQSEALSLSVSYTSHEHLVALVSTADMWYSGCRRSSGSQ